MARRRPTRGASRANLMPSSPFPYLCEALESRRLLTTLHGGDTFIFKDGQSLAQMIVQGSPLTTVEVIGTDGTGAVNEPGTIFSASFPLGNPVFGGVPNSNGPALWNLYISNSDIHTSITAYHIDPTTGAPLPFSGSAQGMPQTINTTACTPGSLTPPGNTGELGLGISDGTAIPVNEPLGSYPASLTTITPGVIVTAGNDLGTFEFCGAVAGQVQIHGSVDLFYAGWLVTGDVFGLCPFPTTTTVPHNFSVDGDLHQLIIKGDIGTDAETIATTPNYITGFDMQVGGRVGEIKTLGDLVGNVSVTGSSGASSLPGTVNEPETRLMADLPLAGENDPIQRNDTFATATFLGTTDNSGTVSVNGELDNVPPINDAADYYAVPLLAGQKVTVKLSPIQTQTAFNVEVFDPDGRMIASDINRVDPAAAAGQPFQFTTDRPGFYRFAVVAGATGTLPYNLTVWGVGNLGWGAMNVGGAAVENGNVPTSLGGEGAPAGTPGEGIVASWHLLNGDFGGIEAAGSVLGNGANSIMVDHGDLRGVVGSSIGSSTTANGTTTIGNGIEAYVPTGNVGLVESTSGGIVWNLTIAQAAVPGSAEAGIDNTVAAPMAVGGGYQLVSSAGNLAVGLIADKGLGVLRGQTMDSNPQSVIDVNADNTPNADGIIDLIDINGQLGDLGGGGPKIRTGPGGNVRYFHVATAAVNGDAVFGDAFFGTGGGQVTDYQPGEAVPFTDDSGSRVTLTPTGQIPNPTFNPALAAGPGNEQFNPGALSVFAYGIEGSGGSALVNITSTAGLTMTVNGNSPNQTAEIGEIDANGPGTAVVAGTTATTTTGGSANSTFPGPGQPGGPPVRTAGNPKTVTLPPPPVLSAAAGSLPLEVILNGNARLDVWNITGTGGQFTNIENDTTGEIANVNAATIGTLSSNGSIGLTQGHNGVAVQGATDFTGNTAPFWGQRNLIQSGSIVSISAPHLGNIRSSGSIGSVVGTIDAPVVAAQNINAANVGGGIGPIGSGQMIRAGLFAGNVMGPVTGTNADIRGAVVGTNGIIGVSLHNGSLINANIGDYNNFGSANLLGNNVVLTELPGIFSNPILDLGYVRVSGNGGIIGTEIGGNHLGPINVEGGFGILDSYVFTAGRGTFQSISTDNYGIRGTWISGGAAIGSITARGNGANVPVSDFSSRVRLSETGSTFDPSGTVHARFNDLDAYLGTSSSNPQILGVTDTGVVEDSTFEGSRTLSNVTAWSIRGTQGPNITTLGATVPGFSTFNIAEKIGTIHTTGPIAGMQVVTGRVQKFLPNGDVSGLDMEISGSIGRAVFNSSLNAGSMIFAKGANGHIGNIVIHGSMDGTIRAFTRIGSIVIDGSLTGLVKANTLGNLKLGGGMGDGSLEIDGNVGTIQTAGDLGAAGNTLTINGTLKALKVGGNLNANVTTGGNTGLVQVGGSVISNTTVTVNGVLNTLKVSHDIQVGAVVKAHLIKKRIIGGQLLGTLTTF